MLLLRTNSDLIFMKSPTANATITYQLYAHTSALVEIATNTHTYKHTWSLINTEHFLIMYTFLNAQKHDCFPVRVAIHRNLRIIYHFILNSENRTAASGKAVRQNDQQSDCSYRKGNGTTQ